MYTLHQEAAQRNTALMGVEAMEAGRHLLCAATFLGCDPTGVENAVSMVEPRRMSAQVLAEKAVATCGDVPPDLNMDWFGVCSNAIWEWTEAEYMVSAKLFMTNSGQPQLSDDADKLNLRKTDSAVGYGAVVYPSTFSPGRICELSSTRMPSKYSEFGMQPVFSGEAFHDVSWVDVNNLRTRHLSSISLLEALENGAALQARHPWGLSRVAINLGGRSCPLHANYELKMRVVNLSCLLVQAKPTCANLKVPFGSRTGFRSSAFVRATPAARVTSSIFNGLLHLPRGPIPHNSRKPAPSHRGLRTKHKVAPQHREGQRQPSAGPAHRLMGCSR